MPDAALTTIEVWNLAVATLGGVAVGIERQWSGHAAGPRARFAGIRTFTLLGLVSGLSGWLSTRGLDGVAMVLLAGLGALVVVAYLSASRSDVDGTTEVGAFVVMATGVLAGLGYRSLASGIIAITVLLLFEKTRLHSFVSRLAREELRAGVRFAVMAAVILPLLPEGPFGPLGGVRPRSLWALVLFFSGISFAGHLARRAFGHDHGYVVAGAIGGVVSSTNTTLTFSRLSASRPDVADSLAAGTLAANVVLFPRILIASAVLAPPLAQAAWPAFVVPAAIGVALAFLGRRTTQVNNTLQDSNPLQLGAALKMTALFQLVLFVVHAASTRLGEGGLYGSAAVLGLTDVDALTISLARAVSSGTSADVAARAVTIGVLANTLVKLGIAVTLGRGRFRPRTAAGLTMMAAALGAAIWWR